MSTGKKLSASPSMRVSRQSSTLLNKEVLSGDEDGSLSITKPKIGILQKQRLLDYKIFLDDQDVTPKPLNPTIFKGAKERQLNVVNMSAIETSTTNLEINSLNASSTGRFKTEIYTTDLNKSYISPSVDETFFLQSTITDTGTDSEMFLEFSEEFEIEEKPSKPIPIPKVLNLTLNETDTFFILDMWSASEIKGSDKGNAAEAHNEKYEYLTVGKGKNRKVIDAMTQTRGIIHKFKETEPEKFKTATQSTFASNWEMYDTFAEELAKRKTIEEEEAQEEEDSHALNEPVSIDSFRLSPEEKQMLNLMENENFHQAVTVIERLLAHKTYSIRQKRFKGLFEVDGFREIIDYKYKLDLLWTFANDKTVGKSVNAINWNPANEDIFAVAYGKFYAADKIRGMVLIWNIKNPVQPERCYFYSESVSAVAFAKTQPHLVAVGLDNGIIQVLDIRERKRAVVHSSGRGINATFETVNYLTFYAGDEHYNYEEQLIACFNDGKICKYRLGMTDDMPCTQIMRAAEVDGRVRGINRTEICGVPAIPLTKYTGAILITFHPIDQNIYYICTNLGAIQKCSTNYYNQHLDILIAHDGPIYQMQFSPFCNKLFVTCGGDWHVRIWADGIEEPILELLTTMYPVQYVLWSPTHSTILVAIQSSQILIWDLHRKVHYPQNIINPPNRTRIAIIKFTKNGKCLTVSDIEGRTYIYCLESMPIPPFFQDHLLYSALRKNLITKPDLLKKFTDLKSLNFKKVSK